MYKFVSKYVTVIRETTWNYEYETNEDFLQHKAKFVGENIRLELTHQCESGKVIASYIERLEQSEMV